MQERYKVLLSRVSDSGENDASRGSSVSSHNSATSHKRRAELRLRQIRERQEIERKSEKLRRELELQTARHKVELAEIEDEEADNDESREYLSLPDGSSPDDKVKNYMKKCSKDLPFNGKSDKLCDNVPPVQIRTQDVHGLPKPELIIKFLSNFETNIEARVMHCKTLYDHCLRTVCIPGDLVLVRNVSIRGKHKLADKWEHFPYTVINQPNKDLPVYEVKREGARYRKTRILLRNLLLPFMSIQADQIPESSDTEEGSDTTDVESHFSDDNLLSPGQLSNVPRYRIPARRAPGELGLTPRSEVDSLPSSPIDSPRPVRKRQKPTWMTSNDWILQ